MAILAAVPFELFRPQLKAALVAGGLRTADAQRKSSAGRKPWDEVLIFKALVLQALAKESSQHFFLLIEQRNYSHPLRLGRKMTAP